MFNTVKMNAQAMRGLMGKAFDVDEYEKGRKDARDLFKKSPEVREEKVEEIKRVLEGGDFRHRPGPSYWIGCLCEADFTW